jgi:hypothetical protein
MLEEVEPDIAMHLRKLVIEHHHGLLLVRVKPWVLRHLQVEKARWGQ